MAAQVRRLGGYVAALMAALSLASAASVSAQQAGGTAPPAGAAANALAGQCFSATDATQIVVGCDAALGPARANLTADQAGLALQRRGGAKAQLGRIDEAIVDFRAMAAANFKAHEAHASIGALEIRRQRFADAERSYREALRINASYALALTGLGHTLLALRRPAEAIRYFDQALAVQDTDASAHLGKGTALHETGNLDGAIRSFGDALRVSPGLIQARYQRAQASSDKGEHAAAITDLDAVLATATGAERVRGLVVRGRLQNAARSFEAAIADCNAANAEADRLNVREAALRASALVCVALARQSRGELVEAKDGYDAALRFEPRDTTALAGRGYVALQRGFYDDAIADLEAVLRIDPRSEDALRFLGLAHADKGDLARAEDAIRRASEANPRDPWPIMIRAVALAKDGLRERALADVERAASIVGQPTSDMHLVRAAVQYFLEDLERSRTELASALRLNPDNGQAHRLLGRIHLRQGRLDDARRSLDVAARWLPNDSSVALTRAQLALARRDGAGALREATLSATLNAAFAETFVARGQAHEALGLTALALSDYQAAEGKIATDPDGRRAKLVARERLAALTQPAGATAIAPSGGSTGATPGERSQPQSLPSAPAGPTSDGRSVYCQLIEGVFVHSRRYTGVEFESGCRVTQ